MTAPEGGLSTGKTVLVIAVVLGCFAVLWPKIFYPMMFEASYNGKKSGLEGKVWKSRRLFSN